MPNGKRNHFGWEMGGTTGPCVLHRLRPGSGQVPDSELRTVVQEVPFRPFLFSVAQEYDPFLRPVLPTSTPQPSPTLRTHGTYSTSLYLRCPLGVRDPYSRIDPVTVPNEIFPFVVEGSRGSQGLPLTGGCVVS